MREQLGTVAGAACCPPQMNGCTPKTPSGNIAGVLQCITEQVNGMIPYTTDIGDFLHGKPVEKCDNQPERVVSSALEELEDISSKLYRIKDELVRIHAVLGI